MDTNTRNTKSAIFDSNLVSDFQHTPRREVKLKSSGQSLDAALSKFQIQPCIQTLNDKARELKNQQSQMKWNEEKH